MALLWSRYAIQLPRISQPITLSQALSSVHRVVDMLPDGATRSSSSAGFPSARSASRLIWSEDIEVYPFDGCLPVWEGKMPVAKPDLTPSQLRVLQGFATNAPRQFEDVETCEQPKCLGLLNREARRLQDHRLCEDALCSRTGTKDVNALIASASEAIGHLTDGDRRSSKYLQVFHYVASSAPSDSHTTPNI